MIDKINDIAMLRRTKHFNITGKQTAEIWGLQLFEYLY